MEIDETKKETYKEICEKIKDIFGNSIEDYRYIKSLNSMGRLNIIPNIVQDLKATVEKYNKMINLFESYDAQDLSVCIDSYHESVYENQLFINKLFNDKGRDPLIEMRDYYRA